MCVNNDIDKLQTKNITKTYNLSKQERNALQQLKTRTDLVITNADKGGAVVIQETEEYIKEAYRQLHDTTFYKKCDFDLTTIHNERVHRVINEFKTRNMISEKTASMLKCDISKAPKFYMLPKIHKTNNPG